MLEKRLLAGRAAENHICRADLVPQQPLELAVAGREDAELGVRPPLALLDGGGHHIQAAEDVLARFGKAAVDDVDVADGAAAEHQGQADVPVGLLARAEGRDGMDLVPPCDEEC